MTTKASTSTKSKSATETAEENLEHVVEVSKEYLEKAKHTTIADLQKEVGNYVKSNPEKSLLIAAGIGFLLGFTRR